MIRRFLKGRNSSWFMLHCVPIRPLFSCVITHCDYSYYTTNNGFSIRKIWAKSKRDEHRIWVDRIPCKDHGD